MQLVITSHTLRTRVTLSGCVFEISGNCSFHKPENKEKYFFNYIMNNNNNNNNKGARGGTVG
jgi:hypothetical protein